MSTKTIPVSRVKDVPADLAAAFRHMPHYRAGKGRDSYEGRTGVNYDPLTTQGTHRSQLVLTGYIDAGYAGAWHVYVLRFDRHADQSFSGAGQVVFYVMSTNDKDNRLHILDWERTTWSKQAALDLAATMTTDIDTWRETVAQLLRKDGRDDLADAFEALSDAEAEGERSGSSYGNPKVARSRANLTTWAADRVTSGATA